MGQKAKLILMRHGQSEWNKLNLFTGWVDVPLSTQGIQEALEAGKKISHIPIDVIFVSSLIRAQTTAMLAMAGHSSKKTPCIQHPPGGKIGLWSEIFSETTKEECIPVFEAWELNERMYGKLQGMNKEEVKQQFGEEQFKLWRRSFDVPPPSGESLKMTAERTLPYFKSSILPYLKSGQTVLISAHGNSLRSIVMDLEKLSNEEVVNLEIATGEPIIYEFSNDKWEKQK